MCPAITAEPVAPGRGLPVYQPATAMLAGTCGAPVAVTPSRTRRVLTPIAGITRPVGLGAATAAAVAPGTAAQWPAGIGTSGA